MAIGNIVSELVLVAAGFGALALCSQRRNAVADMENSRDSLGILAWAMFMLPIMIAALFGALRFAEVHPSMLTISVLFQQIAKTIGTCGLVLAMAQLLKKETQHHLAVAGTVVVGVILFAAVRFGQATELEKVLPLIGMLIALCVGIYFVARGQHIKSGAFLLTAVILAALATAALGKIQPRSMAIDAYHYLLAISLICFGLAARERA